MTKLRPPLSVEQALTRIAGQVPGDWQAMAAVVGRAERTVRNWSDPDTPEDITIRAAIALDLEYQRCGGIGAPINDVYALLLKTGGEEVFACQAKLAAATMVTVVESAEAIVAQIAAAQPGADKAAIDHAIRQTEEDIAADQRTLSILRASRPPP